MLFRRAVTMRLSFRLLAAGMLLALPVQVMAQSSIASGEVRSGTLSFDGRATVGNFVGTTSTVTGAMTGGADLSAVQGWVEAPVNTLKTRNNHRDRDLNKSIRIFAPASVESKRLLIEITKQMERLNAHICPFDGPFQ